MAQFVAFDPKVEVIGTAIMSIAAGLGKTALPILSTHGLDTVDPDQWYSQQTWLDALKDIAMGQYNAMFDLVAVGMAVPNTAVFPPDVNSMVSALVSIDAAYHMNHRGGEIGSYQISESTNDQLTVICRNPYPCDFDYGLIYSMARRFRPRNAQFTVYHDDQCGCRKKGAVSCTYHVRVK